MWGVNQVGGGKFVGKPGGRGGVNQGGGRGLLDLAHPLPFKQLRPNPCQQNLAFQSGQLTEKCLTSVFKSELV